MLSSYADKTNTLFSLYANIPAAAYLEMARAACVALSGGGGGASLRRVYFLQPLVLDGGLSEAQVRVGVIEDRFEVTYEGGGEASTAHCAGDASAASGPLPGLSLAAARASCGEAVDAASLYSLLRSVGLEYGPRYRTLELAAVSRAAGAAVGRLCRRSQRRALASTRPTSTARCTCPRCSP